MATSTISNTLAHPSDAAAPQPPTQSTSRSNTTPPSPSPPPPITTPQHPPPPHTELLTHLQSQTSNWRLSNDSQLATLLTQISHHMTKEITSMSRNIQKLEQSTTTLATSISSHHVALAHISNTQFIEHLAAEDEDDDDDDDEEEEKKQKLSDSSSSVSFSRNSTCTSTSSSTQDDEIQNAINNGMKALNLFLDPARRTPMRNIGSYYNGTTSSDAVGAAILDSCYGYESAREDEFNSRPLPYVVGSEEFRLSQWMGLCPEEYVDDDDEGDSEEEEEGTEERGDAKLTILYDGRKTPPMYDDDDDDEEDEEEESHAPLEKNDGISDNAAADGRQTPENNDAPLSSVPSTPSSSSSASVQPIESDMYFAETSSRSHDEAEGTDEKNASDGPLRVRQKPLPADPSAADVLFLTKSATGKSKKRGSTTSHNNNNTTADPHNADDDDDDDDDDSKVENNTSTANNTQKSNVPTVVFAANDDDDIGESEYADDERKLVVRSSHHHHHHHHDRHYSRDNKKLLSNKKKKVFYNSEDADDERYTTDVGEETDDNMNERMSSSTWQRGEDMGGVVLMEEEVDDDDKKDDKDDNAGDGLEENKTKAKHLFYNTIKEGSTTEGDLTAADGNGKGSAAISGVGINDDGGVTGGEDDKQPLQPEPYSSDESDADDEMSERPVKKHEKNKGAVGLVAAGGRDIQETKKNSGSFYDEESDDSDDVRGGGGGGGGGNGA